MMSVGVTLSAARSCHDPTIARTYRPMPRRSCGRFHASTATRNRDPLTRRSEKPEPLAPYGARGALRERHDERIAQIATDGAEPVRGVVAAHEIPILLLAETQPVAGRIRCDLHAAQSRAFRKTDHVVERDGILEHAVRLC